MITLSKRIVDVETIADYFGCGERNIQIWVDDLGAPNWQTDKSLRRGEYNLDEFIKWRLKYLDEQIKIEKAGGQEKYKLEAEGQRLQNIERAQKILMKQKKLVDFSKVREAYVNDAAAYSNGLDKLDYKIAEHIETVHDKDKLKKKIHAEIIDLRNRIGTELKINDEDIEDIEDEEPEKPETDEIESNQ